MTIHIFLCGKERDINRLLPANAITPGIEHCFYMYWAEKAVAVDRRKSLKAHASRFVQTLSLSVINIYSLRMQFYDPTLHRVPDKNGFRASKNNNKSFRLQNRNSRLAKHPAQMSFRGNTN